MHVPGSTVITGNRVDCDAVSTEHLLKHKTHDRVWYKTKQKTKNIHNFWPYAKVWIEFVKLGNTIFLYINFKSIPSSGLSMNYPGQPGKIRAPGRPEFGFYSNSRKTTLAESLNKESLVQGNVFIILTSFVVLPCFCTYGCKRLMGRKIDRCDYFIDGFSYLRQNKLHVWPVSILGRVVRQLLVRTRSVSEPCVVLRFSSIAIELKVDGQRTLILSLNLYIFYVCLFVFVYCQLTVYDS